MRARWIALLLILTLVAACNPFGPAAAASNTLTVFADASLTEPFSEIGQQMEAQIPGVKVVFSFASSPALAQQLAQKDAADVFASAGTQAMDDASGAMRVDVGDVQVFAHNHLVIIFPIQNPGGISAIKDLANAGLKLDLAGPADAAGQYSLDFLDKSVQEPLLGESFKTGALKNVMAYEETDRDVLEQVTQGKADAGIVFASDANESVSQLDIPAALNVDAAYAIAPISDSTHAGLAEAFVTLVLSPTGQGILQQYNFTPLN